MSCAVLLSAVAIAVAPAAAASRPATRPTVTPKQPVSLAVGPHGDLYVADAAREQILRRLPSGRFVVVARTGVAPGSLAIAPNGTVYFAQEGRTKGTVVRAVEPNGEISTVVGGDPNCAAVPAGALSIPAQSALLSGASLTIGSGGRLELSTTVCPNVLRLGGFLRLTASGKLVPTPADSIPHASGYCGGGVAGRGFIAFGCDSGAGRGPRLMIVRANGSIENYPDAGSQPNDMSASSGTVVAIHNGAVVRIHAHGLETIATLRRLAELVSGNALRMGDNGIAIDRRGNVYVNQDFLVAHRGCTDVIVEIDPNGHMRMLWRSPATRSCY